ncbi:TolC family protein [Pedobacter vanadiisoli]|uniref:TolC family protein n=1 Tax=Pedobacter vanadiisoli TaxID=1761975 RepID=A0ABW5MHJ2_9SPHI
MMIKKMKNNRYLYLLLLLIGSQSAYAQTDTAFIKKELKLEEYLNLVGRQNLGYLAGKYNVSIAEANIESARVFPDPQLSVGGYDNQQSSLHLGRGYNTSISTTLELGGKRKSRIALAESQSEVSKALLLDFFRNLRADATLAYFNALQQYHLLGVLQNSYSTMKQLADADSTRFRLGSATETDARQSKLEASNLLNNLIQAEADWKTTLVQLNLNAGMVQPDIFLVPANDFRDLKRTFSLLKLISDAQANRSDAVAASNTQIAAKNTLQLAKANRAIDLGLSIGMQYSGASTNEIAPTPAYRSVNVGISVPLKFSNAYKGELKTAQFLIKQTKIQYEQVALQIQTEVTQAYINYKAAEKQVSQYNNALLADAHKIFEAKTYSYKRGETSLLEVLNAQRTYNEVQQSYYQAQYNYTATLVQLERAAGIWDLK